jgi:hypothetical protein
LTNIKAGRLRISHTMTTPTELKGMIMRAFALLPLLAIAAVPAPAFTEAGDVLVRVRAVVVSPNED